MVKAFLKVSAICFALGLVVLGGVGLNVVSGRTERHPYGSTLRIVKDVQIALNCWITEYNALPLLGREALMVDVEMEVHSHLLAALQGEPLIGNVRRICFLGQMPAKPKRAGVEKNEEGMRLVDQWGRIVEVVLDGNGDNKLVNPDVKNSDEAIRSTAP